MLYRLKRLSNQQVPKGQSKKRNDGKAISKNVFSGDNKGALKSPGSSDGGVLELEREPGGEWHCSKRGGVYDPSCDGWGMAEPPCEGDVVDLYNIPQEMPAAKEEGGT